MTAYAYVRPERVGLGNKLFPWARAAIFAQTHGIPMLAVRWTQLKIGPILRGERDKRFYVGLFSNRGYVKGPRRWTALAGGKVDENDAPGVETILQKNRGVIVFTGMGKMFDDLRGKHQWLWDRLESMLAPTLQEQLKQQTAGGPFMAIHVRRGDVRPLAFGQPHPDAPGHYYSQPVEWYAEVARQLRQRTQHRLPIRLFSDAADAEIEPLLKVQGVSLIRGNPSIIDMLLMARAKIIVPTGNSTFSMWSAFLGQMPVIYYPGNAYRLAETLDQSIEADLNGALPASCEKTLAKIGGVGGQDRINSDG